jgi:hypothetical protein
VCFQAVFSFLFGDGQFMRCYHKEANDDPDADVTCWTAAGERTVSFSAPLNVPALVRKFVGEPSTVNVLHLNLHVLLPHSSF